MNKKTIAILGAGNIGIAIANGLTKAGSYQPKDIVLTRRRIHLLESLKAHGFSIEPDNCVAVAKADIIIISVEPQQLNEVLHEIDSELNAQKHLLISVVTGATTKQISRQLTKPIDIIRAMPNTAIAVGESITCLTTGYNLHNHTIEEAQKIFNTVGKTIVIPEEEMTAATALGACGIAFFLRAIRAASQGGIEIGFSSEDALAIAAQVARGAATLLLSLEHHPEYEIDKVTTPKGCTIAGLNQMEHEGFSSALIKGITVSAQRAAQLYNNATDQ